MIVYNVLDILPIEAGAFFVTRAKSNIKARRVYSAPVDKATGLICDQRRQASGSKSLCTTRVRRELVRSPPRPLRTGPVIRSGRGNQHSYSAADPVPVPPTTMGCGSSTVLADSPRQVARHE